MNCPFRCREVPLQRTPDRETHNPAFDACNYSFFVPLFSRARPMLFYYSDTQCLKAMYRERNTTVGASSFDS